MFTGLVERVGRVSRIESRGPNRRFFIAADFADELRLGESVAVNGCCLTVVGTDRQEFQVEAVAATLRATNLGEVRIGERVNLERALRVGDRLGGHIVLGHIDEVGRIRRLERRAGEVLMVVAVKKENSQWLVAKGSVAVDGVSLTVAAKTVGEFTVNLIPFTLQETNLGMKKPGERVNIEYDVLVKAAREGKGWHPGVSFGTE